MAEVLTRKCRGCGASTQAMSLKFKRSVATGRVEERDVAVGGLYCDDCEDKRQREDLERLTRERIDQYRQWACVPQRYAKADFTGFTAPEALEAAEAWSRGELRGLCLTGDVGVGKSWLAAAALWAMIRRRAAEDAAEELDEASDDAPRRMRPVRWVSVSGLMADLRRSFSDSDRADAVKVVAGRSAIVLDDLDKVNPSEFGKEIIFSTLDARVAADAPVLVTTNATPAELGRKLGKAVMSRIAGECMVVKMVGPDRRIQPRPA